MSGIGPGTERRAWVRGAPVLALAGFALALTLPGLGASGLWEPDERAVAQAAVEGRSACVPGQPFRSLLPALGLRLLGASETSARLPGALGALLCAALVLAAGRVLGGMRAGLYSAAVLLTLPAFVLGARQLTTEIPLLGASALSLLGLGGFVVARSGRRWLLLGLGLLGLLLGTLSGGLLVGAVGPALALAGAVALSAWQPAESAALPRPIRAAALGLGVVAALSLGLALLLPHTGGQPSWRLGGVPGGAGATFEGLLRGFGFGVFPLGALAFFALLRPLLETDQPPASPAMVLRRFVDRYLLLSAALGLALGTVRLQLTGEMTLALLPAVALSLGRFLDEQSRAPQANLLLALLIGGGAMMVARDLSQEPQQLAASYLTSKLTWPVTLDVRAPLLVAGAGAGAAMMALVGVPAMGPAGGSGRLSRLLEAARRSSPLVLLGSGALLALWMSHRLIPEVGRHLSPRSLFDTYHRLRPPAATRADTIAIFGAAARGAPWATPDTREIASLAALGDVLRAGGGGFVIVPRGELARIDRHLAEQGIPYAVADASSSRLLLLAGQLPPGHADENPLTSLRWRASLGGSRPPWPAPGQPLSATFGDAIELRGVDLPAVVHRPGKLPLGLHFRARATPPPGHHIFVHLERPGTLLNGDHPPLAGIFPTAHWLPGDELRDQHQIPLPLVLAPTGRYRVLVGIWPGGNTERRLPVTSGEHDGRHRVFVGTVEVR